MSTLAVGTKKGSNPSSPHKPDSREAGKETEDAYAAQLAGAKKSEIPIVHDAFKVVSDGNISVLLRLMNDETNPLNIHKSRWSGFTLLHRAASQGHTDIVQILVDAGAKINEKSVWGWYTPFHLALANGWEETAKWFVLNGADIHAKSKTGDDACDYAKRRGYKQLAMEFRTTMQKLQAMVRLKQRKERQAAISQKNRDMQGQGEGQGTGIGPGTGYGQGQGEGQGEGQLAV